MDIYIYIWIGLPAGVPTRHQIQTCGLTNKCVFHIHFVGCYSATDEPHATTVAAATLGKIFLPFPPELKL